MSEEKKVPTGVWIFWGSLGAALIIRLLPWSALTGATFSSVISLVSALGTVGAVVVAYFSIHELRKDRKADRDNRRPYFSFLKGEIGQTMLDEDEPGEFIDFTCENVGTNPAADVTGTIIILLPFYRNPVSEVVTYRAVNDIAGGFEFNIDLAGHLLLDCNTYHYIVFDLDYYDAVYGSNHKQRFYFQWPGLEVRKVSRPVHSITREVKPFILELLEKTGN